MNYDRVKYLFIELYKEFGKTFDNFESDFANTINKQIIQKPKIIIVHDTYDEIVNYFEKITHSREAVECFIKKLAPSVKARQRFDVSSSYHYLVAKETKTSNIEIGRNAEANYAAFKRKLLATYQITQKDIHALIKAAN